jgi:hypothetical protein
MVRVMISPEEQKKRVEAAAQALRVGTIVSGDMDYARAVIALHAADRAVPVVSQGEYRERLAEWATY